MQVIGQSQLFVNGLTRKGESEMNDNMADIKTSKDSLFICEKWTDQEVYPYRVADINRYKLIPFVPDRNASRAFGNRSRLMAFHCNKRGQVFCANWKTTGV